MEFSVERFKYVPSRLASKNTLPSRDLVADELEHAAERVADDGRAQVPDVHLLRDVRGREVHRHALRPRIPHLIDVSEEGPSTPLNTP